MKMFALLLYSIQIYANCSLYEQELSDNYYDKARLSQNITKQIAWLKKAENYCSAPEIKTTLLLMKAKNSHDQNTQIAFYKQALVSVSQFENYDLLQHEQKRINLFLAKLLQSDEPLLAQTYKQKALQNPQDKKSSHLWVWILFGSLLLWAIAGSLKRHTKHKRLV